MQFSVRVLLLVGICWLTQTVRAETPLRVLTSVKPLQLIALAVGGDAIQADALLDPQFSPHDYQLRPSDRAKLDTADVVFWVGPKLEVFLQSPLATLTGRATVISLQDADEDPHVWMDPMAAAAIAHRMATVFAALRPQRRDYFDANVERVAAALRRQDAEHRAQLKQLPALRGLLVTHDAYGRFERRYGLTHRAALTNMADMPPSVKALLGIERELADGRIGCIWRQPHEGKLYQRLTSARKIRSATIDSMAAEIPASPEGLLMFYEQLWRAAIFCLAD